MDGPIDLPSIGIVAKQFRRQTSGDRLSFGQGSIVDDEPIGVGKWFRKGCDLSLPTGIFELGISQ